MSDAVKVPDTADEAAAMLRVAAHWLEANAPDVLRATMRGTADAMDAARYRWLRSRLPGGAYRIAGVIYSEGGKGVDAAIDAAMARESAAIGGAR